MTPKDYDFVVVGSGAAGLSAAVTAAYHGLRVAVFEKDTSLGGATAWSGGWMWVPRNFHAIGAGIIEDIETVREYLKHELGSKYDAAKIDSFLTHAPQMAEFFHQHTKLQFDHGNAIADIHYQSPGAGTGGRSLIAKPFDGRALGKNIQQLRTTMRETAFLGMPIQAGDDLWAFLNATRSMKASIYACKRLFCHGVDMLYYGRAMQLRNGVALVGRLAKSAIDLGVDLYTESPVTELISKNGRVCGVTITTNKQSYEITARCGVLLATGGFAHNTERRKQLFKRTPTGHEHWPLPPKSVTGDGLTLAESVGAAIDDQVYSAAAWAPVSLVPHADGTTGHFPHIIDRAKPGAIAVLANGQRFINEADGYFDFVDALVNNAPENQEVAAWLVCDYQFQRRYGLGYTRPFPLPYRYWIKRGYLKSGKTIEELAQACGINAQSLKETIKRYNRDAIEGRDSEFGRGQSPYNQKNGDPSHQPNPCIAPIVKAPYFAVKIVPGSFGTFAGIKTNGLAQAVNDQNNVIEGLWAAGSDMASIMGGYYPAGGINLGPAMTFGYLAALNAVENSSIR